MQTLWLLLKIAGAVVASALLLGALYVGAVLIRKSGWFMLRSDLQKLAEGACADAEVATALCGAPAELIIGGERPPGSWPEYEPPEVSLSSWRLWFPMSGTLEARVAGFGAVNSAKASGNNRVTKVSGQRCQGTIRFGYRFHWGDNGRAVVLDSAVEGKTQVLAQR